MIPTSARFPFPFALTFTAGALMAGLGILGSACSSTPATETPDAAPPPASCDTAKCAPGNECIAVGGETKCRKTCSSNSEAAKACPFGYACTALTPQASDCKGSECICTEIAVKLEKKDKGQWGAACNPGDGLAANPACDSAQQFQCYAQNPVDGAAYCTRACEKDAECGAGLFCGAVNDSPSAEEAKRTGTGTIKICQKHAYGSPCSSTVDCGPGLLCSSDDKNQPFCTNACATDNNCAVDAFCGDGLCYPNARLIVGEGGLCSPCRSDLDCAAGKGVCGSNSYTTERFCTVPSASACKAQDCPKPPDGVTSGGCTTQAFDDIPAGQCVGLFKLGSNQLPGCWTRTRRK